MKRLALALLLLPSAALGDAGGPDAYKVVGLNPTEVLNMRIGPSFDYDIAGTLPPDARHLAWEVCVPTLSDGQFQALQPSERAKIAGLPRWCLLRREDGLRGWVNARFLSEDSLK